MADEQILRTHSPERRLVMPELGSRYQPRRVPARSVDGVQHQPRPSAPQPTTVHPRPAIKPKQHTSTDQVIAPKKSRQVATAKPALPRQNKSMVLKRHIDAKAHKYQKQARRERWQQVKAFMLGTTIAAIVAAIGVGFAIVRTQSSAKTDNQAAVSAALGAQTAADLNGPDETPVTIGDMASYVTEPKNPRVVRIPRLGTQARVMQVKASLAGEPVPTDNIHDMGWLSTSAKPGEAGVEIMNGYITGTTQAGALNAANTLQPGDPIQVERGDGKTVEYTVKMVKTFAADKVDMTLLKTSAEAGRPGLNVLTNTGRFNVRTNQFEDRLLIMAVVKS